MAEILSYDPAGDPEVVGAIETDQAESLAIGEEMINQANARLAGKYKDAQELEKAYMELEKKLGAQEKEQPQAEQTEEAEEALAKDMCVAKPLQCMDNFNANISFDGNFFSFS